MARLARVYCCAKCPFGWYEGDWEFVCTIVAEADGADRSAGSGDAIPDWCPLPEAEETDGDDS